MKKIFSICCILAFTATVTTPNYAFAAEDSEEQVIEVFKILPGKHEEFLEFVTMLDEIYKELGLEPRQLYVHSTGSDFDFMLIQPSSMDPEVSKLYSQKLKERNVPSGYDFFVYFREFFASHHDDIVTGPTTAEDVLHSFKESRAKRIAREQGK